MDLPTPRYLVVGRFVRAQLSLYFSKPQEAAFISPKLCTHTYSHNRVTSPWIVYCNRHCDNHISHDASQEEGSRVDHRNAG